MDDAPEVCFLSPQSLRATAIAELLATAPDAATLPEKVAEVEAATLNGEYREDSAEGALCLWVDDAPEDSRDPAGHFERYDPETHGEPYHPIPSRRMTDALRVSREGGASVDGGAG